MFHTYHQGRLVPVAGMILVDGMVINGAAWGEGDNNSCMAMIRIRITMVCQSIRTAILP